MMISLSKCPSTSISATLACVLLFFTSSSRAFQVGAPTERVKRRSNLVLNSNVDRRGFLVGAACSSLIFHPATSRADEDLTAQMFNPDGSLKEGVSTEMAKSKLIAFEWGLSESKLVNIDGKNVEGTTSGSNVRISYELPNKWGRGSDIYIDTSEGVNSPACKRITVYKAAGKASADRLDKASTIGVGTALEATDDLGKLKTADIIGGRKRTRNDGTYYEFDMASAPEKCETGSKDDLGLGFCPYDTILLISATILEERLYVMAIECDNLEWKQGNADLKRVRSSFKVEPIA
jgi:hypothetical protein